MLDKFYANHPKYRGLAPYSICDGFDDDSWCINANRSSDGAVRYANDVGLNMYSKIVNKRPIQFRTYAEKRNPGQEICHTEEITGKIGKHPNRL